MRLILNTTLALLALCSFTTSQAQVQNVVASSGGTMIQASISVDFTLGEVVADFSEAGGLVISQGFHQPELKTTGAIETAGLPVALFPNPTRSGVQVEWGTGVAQLEVYDVAGQQVCSLSRPGPSTYVNLDVLSAGHYLMRVSTTESSSIHNLIKTQ